MIRLLLIAALLLPAALPAGEFDRQLRTDPPRTGRMIASDGDASNKAATVYCTWFGRLDPLQ